MGYTINQAEWWTIWQVQAAPTEPLTIAAHLYADDPTPTVADGLGFHQRAVAARRLAGTDASV